MPEEILTVVRLPLADLSEEIKRRHGLAETLVDSRIEGDALVMYFSKTAQASKADPGPMALLTQSNHDRQATVGIQGGRRRRRSTGKRNRMRTRGWKVVDRFTNSRGQTALVYQPFVDALAGKQLSLSQQKAMVTQILKSNGNRPSHASVEYFWTNTVEYLRRQLPVMEA